jgi:hypothetical protein
MNSCGLSHLISKWLPANDAPARLLLGERATRH